MIFDYFISSDEQVQFCVRRAHELRAEAWHKFFVGCFNVPARTALWVVEKVRGVFQDKTIAP